MSYLSLSVWCLISLSLLCKTPRELNVLNLLMTMEAYCISVILCLHHSVFQSWLDLWGTLSWINIGQKVVISLKGYWHFHQSLSASHRPCWHLPCSVLTLCACARTYLSNFTAELCRWHWLFAYNTCTSVLSLIQKQSNFLHMHNGSNVEASLNKKQWSFKQSLTLESWSFLI